MQRITLGTYYASSEMLDNIDLVTKSGRLSYGEFSQRLEAEFATLCKQSYGVLSNSGTSSLQVALQACKEKYRWRGGAHVLVPATTFVATVNAVLHAGLTPILVDTNPITWDLDASYVNTWPSNDEKAVAVITVNLFGKPSQLKQIRKECDLNNIIMIEDSCEAVGALHHGEPVGSYGDISVFSFYMAHIITAGVGGIAITSERDLARRMRSLVNHGISHQNLPDTYKVSFLGRNFDFTSIGHSFRITEFEAVVALSNLHRIKEIISKRQDNASLYDKLLGDISSRTYRGYFQTAYIASSDTSSWMMYPIVLRKEKKYKLMQHLRLAGIEVRDMMPLTNQPCYSGMWNKDDYHVAKIINERGLYFGCHEGLSSDDITYVANTIVEYFE